MGCSRGIHDVMVVYKRYGSENGVHPNFGAFNFLSDRKHIIDYWNFEALYF